MSEYSLFRSESTNGHAQSEDSEGFDTNAELLRQFRDYEIDVLGRPAGQGPEAYDDDACLVSSRQSVAEGDKLRAASEPSEHPDRPTVHVRAGHLPEIVDDAERYLMASKVPVFQHAGRLVRIGRVVLPKRPPFLGLTPITLNNLIETLTRLINFERFDARRDKLVPVDCPRSVAATLLERTGQWRLPAIHAVITAPTLRVDGSIFDRPGFDAESGIYYDPLGVGFPPIPDQPTKEEARAALDKIKRLVAEVPFVGEGVDADAGADTSRSVFLSGLLTGLIRPFLPAAPMHTISGTVAGSGKSKLVDTIAIAMTGGAAPVYSQGHSEAEAEKRLATALLAGDPVISFDNCEQPISGELLCQAVTQPFLSIRVLGRTEKVTVANNAMYFATGNSLVVVGDLIRRSLRCKLDPRCEKPEERVFTTEPPDTTMRRLRTELVVAGLTVLRAFFVAGQPQQSTPLGSFEDWSRTVRDALIWIGEPDPCRTTEWTRRDDPERQKIATVMREWFAVFGDAPVTTKDVIDAALRMADGARDFVYPLLRDALIAVAGDLGKIDKDALGTWIGRHKERIIDSHQIVPCTMRNGYKRWKVERQSNAFGSDRLEPTVCEAERRKRMIDNMCRDPGHP